MSRGMHTATLAGLAQMLTLLVGCTVTRVPLNTPASYPIARKVPLHVELRIKAEYATYEFKQSGLQTYRFDHGLRENAEVVARSVFERVTVRDPTEPPVAADAVLVPAIVTVQRTFPSSAFGEAHCFMEIEWRVEDPRGQVVWLATTRGEGTGKLGMSFEQEARAREQFQAMSDAAFRKGYEKMIAAQELRAFARTVPGGGA